MVGDPGAAPVTAYVGLGSNLGDREANLRRAVDLLERTPGVVVRRASALYETSPVGYREQGWFLNAVVEVETTLAPEALLRVLKEVERAVGREPGPRWGPRSIDLDLLLYGDARVETPTLRVPHPALEQRRFVLIPLRDLLPGWIGSDGRSVDDLIAAAPPDQEVVLVRRDW